MIFMIKLIKFKTKINSTEQFSRIQESIWQGYGNIQKIIDNWTPCKELYYEFKLGIIIACFGSSIVAKIALENGMEKWSKYTENPNRNDNLINSRWWLRQNNKLFWLCVVYIIVDICCLTDANGEMFLKLLKNIVVIMSVCVCVLLGWSTKLYNG